MNFNCFYAVVCGKISAPNRLVSFHGIFDTLYSEGILACRNSIDLRHWVFGILFRCGKGKNERGKIPSQRYRKMESVPRKAVVKNLSSRLDDIARGNDTRKSACWKHLISYTVVNCLIHTILVITVEPKMGMIAALCI